jgi:hypothetical protein
MNTARAAQVRVMPPATEATVLGNLFLPNEVAV